MRPLIRLFGQCELIVDGSPVPVRITRKLWYVLSLIATSPNCELGRTELTEAAWPLSDDKSRNVLLHMWRRSVVDATADFLTGIPVVISEHHVAIDTLCLAIDFQECHRLARIALHSADAQAVLDAGIAFDALAEDKVLLPSFPSAFTDIRKEFDLQRTAVLRRSWQAEVNLSHKSQLPSSVFEARLRSLGDTHPVGNPASPFQTLDNKPPETRSNRLTTSQLTAAVIIASIVILPVAIGHISTTSKRYSAEGLRRTVNRPLSDLSRSVLFHLSKPDMKVSLATAIATSPSGQIIVAGYATTHGGTRKTVTSVLDMSGKVMWLTMLKNDQRAHYTPVKVLQTTGGVTVVASQVRVKTGNQRNLKPGNYLGVTSYSKQGDVIADHVYPDAIADNSIAPIHLLSDLNGGAVAFAHRRKQNNPLCVRVNNHTKSTKDIGFPPMFRLTDAITDGNRVHFYIGYVPVRRPTGTRVNWCVKAVDLHGFPIWSKFIDGATGPNATNVRGVINPLGNLVVYGARPSPNPQHRGRLVASMITLSPATGNVIQRDHFDSDNQNLDFALCCIPTAMATVMGVTQRSANGSETITMHRFGNAETDTALTLTVRLPGHQRVDSFISLNFDANGALHALLRPSAKNTSNIALTYVRKYYGREISTGSLRASVPFAYSVGSAGYVAGQYNNAFCVYNFSQLP